MKHLLVITGAIAAGKSTFARSLSQRYQVTVLTKDDIKEVLGDSVGFANREENKRLSVAAVQILVHVFRATAKAGADLILEANFSEKEIACLYEAAKEHGYSVLTIFLYGDSAILHQRYLYRMRHENRHPAHLSAVIEDPEEFRRIQEYLEGVRIPGEVVRICADDFSYAQDGDILQRLDRFMSDT